MRANQGEISHVQIAPSGQSGGRILVVDDESGIRQTIHRYLTRLGHHVQTADTIGDAVRVLAQEELDLVITDLRLPDRSGIDLLVEIRSRAPETRLILMSAFADVPTASSAIEQGIDRLFTKPFPLSDLGEQVERSLERRRTRLEAERERRALEAKLRLRDVESKAWVRRAAHALTQAVEAKDRYTAGHARRVTAYAVTIADAFGGIDPLLLHLAGELHDVGKIGVPDHILNKPDRLTPEEQAQVQEHPAIGARILGSLIDDAFVIGVVRWHHERWDGAGYPDGLHGDRIPIGARIVAVADTLDAMTSRRAYRNGLPWETAVAEIRRCSGTQFDPAVVSAFETVLPKLQEQYRSSAIRPERDSIAS